jgi:hypothetical protein
MAWFVEVNGALGLANFELGPKRAYCLPSNNTLRDRRITIVMVHQPMPMPCFRKINQFTKVFGCVTGVL